jgi:hypothetical protein
MNDMVFLCENAVTRSGGLSRTDFAALNWAATGGAGWLI